MFERVDIAKRCDARLLSPIRPERIARKRARGTPPCPPEQLRCRLFATIATDAADRHKESTSGPQAVCDSLQHFPLMPFVKFCDMLRPSPVNCAVVLALALGADAAGAARPMMTDDARIVDAGACQVETWERFNRDTKEYWALPACNPSGNLEITLGSAKLPVDDGLLGSTRTIQLQGKTLFKTLEPNGYSYGLVLGGIIRPNSVGDQVPNYYGYVPYSRSLFDDGIVVHVNLGVQRAGATPVDSMTYGVGTEIRVTPRAYIIAEVFGDNHTAQSYHGGARVWIVPNHVQVDATVGARAGEMGPSRWFTLGLRLISVPFLK
jgi:hypothetical protein